MKRLITDRDVMTGAVGRRIVLDGQTLITPSARDRACRMGIEIVEPGAPAPPPAPAADDAFPAGLADGLYLVRVEGGRVVSAQPGTGPGRMDRAR